MLVCVMLATAAFVTYTARMDWKRAAEEVSALPVTKETMPDTILSAPHPRPCSNSSRGLPMTLRVSCDLGKGTDSTLSAILLGALLKQAAWHLLLWLRL